jgi:S1-C subfamily serine protease
MTPILNKSLMMIAAAATPFIYPSVSSAAAEPAATQTTVIHPPVVVNQPDGGIYRPATNIPAANIDAWTQQVAQSLVQVEYTAQDEFQKSSIVDGQGIVFTKDGVVIISSDLIPSTFPLSYVTHLIIRIPSGDLPEIPAHYLGRSIDGVFCFIKADKPLNLPPLVISHPTEPFLGEPIISIGRMDQSLGFIPYIGIDRVSIIAPEVHKLISTASRFGLTQATSPVYDFDTHDFLGLTVPNSGVAMVISILGRDIPTALHDPEAPGLFVSWETLQNDLVDVPEKPFPFVRPWIGTSESTGLTRAIRKLYHIKPVAGLVVGDVIPGMAADKAGLKSQDIILTINGVPFSEAPEPDLMSQDFERNLEQMHPGQVVTFGVLRDGVTNLTIPITVSRWPDSPAQMPRYTDNRLGLVARGISFEDTYDRKLSQTQKGVIVALLREGAPAVLGQTPLEEEDLITRINDQPVTDVKQFAQLLQQAENATGAVEVVFVVIKTDGSTGVCHVNLN